MIPESVLTGLTGERRRANQDAAGGARVWDPDGPTAGSLTPALWDTLRESVLWAEAEWERVIQMPLRAEKPRSSAPRHGIRQEVAGAGRTQRRPRNALSRRWLGSSARVYRTSRAFRRLTGSSCISCTPSNEWAAPRSRLGPPFTDRLSSPTSGVVVEWLTTSLAVTSILFWPRVCTGRSGRQPVQ